MGDPNRTLTLSLGGTELHLRYEALELMELKKLSGKSASSFISELAPKNGEETADTILRTMDLDTVVPVIQAGLASDDRYAALSPRKLTAKICELIDKEARKTNEAVMTVAGLCAMKLWPVLTESCLPPGMTIADVEREQAAKKKGQSPEPEAVTNSLGTNSWSPAQPQESSPESSIA